MKRTSFRRQAFEARLRSKQQLFKTGTSFALKASPFFNGRQYCCFNSVFCNHLRALLQRDLKKLAESCLCVLDFPVIHKKILYYCSV
jgi:hypothetical protein